MSNRVTLNIIDYNEDPNALIRKINANFAALNKNLDIVDAAGTSGGGGGGGQITHQDLGDSVTRNNCHPMSAITGLDTALLGKADKNIMPDIYFDEVHPPTSIYETTSETLPEEIERHGEWELIGTREVGTKTISIYERLR